MPAVSRKQQKAACAEYGRRKRGKTGGRRRAFGTAKTSDVRDFCRNRRGKRK